jgi:ABC-type bacteriocin/lantibiotic exporter with double-glycine peptidase domain
MPLSDEEQRILNEIERQLAEDDPRLVEQVGRTTLSSHLTRRIRLASLAFLVGFLMMVFAFATVLWVAAAGFVVMVLSSLLVARYVRQLGRDQVRAMQQEGGFSSMLARIAARFRRPQEPPAE